MGALWGPRLIDFSICGLLMAAPLFLGGRHPLGRWVYAILILVGVLGMWLSLLGGRRIPLSTNLLVLLGLGLLIPALQSLPLPIPLPSWFAPGQEALAGQTWLDSGQPPIGSTLSVAPAITQSAWPALIQYGAFFLVVSLRVQSWRDAEKLIAVIGIGGGLLAILAILQAAGGNGKFLWVYDHPTRLPLAIPRGPFQNENHLCHLLALSLPGLIYWIVIPWTSSLPHPERQRRSGEGAMQWLAVGLTIALLSAIYATPSRGGAAIVLVGLGGATAFWLWQQLGRRLDGGPRRWWWTGGWAALLVLIAIACGSLLRMMPTLSYWRLKIWEAAWALCRDFPIFGSGLGTQRHIYRAYFDEYFEKTFANCESSWLQIFAETGLVGGATMLAIIVATAAALTRAAALPWHGRQRLLLAGVFGSLVASVLHALMDFPWHIPACAVPAIAMAALAHRLPSLVARSTCSSACSALPVDGATEPAGHPQSRRCRERDFAVATVLLLGVAGGVFTGLAPARASLAWDQFRRDYRDQEDPIEGLSRKKLAQLYKIVHTDPLHVEARLRLCQTLAAAANYPEPLQLSSESLARRALIEAIYCRTLVPSDGRPYLYAALAGATWNFDLEQQQRLLEHAQRLRRVDGKISIQRAILQMMQGDLEGAFTCWHDAIERDPTTRKIAWKTLTSAFSVEDLLERLEPSHDAAQPLFRWLITNHQADQAAIVGTYLCQQAQQSLAAHTDPRARREILERTTEYAAAVHDPSLKIALYEPLVKLLPSHVEHRLVLADAYLDAGEIDKATAEADQGRRLQPMNDQVRQMQLRCARLARVARATAESTQQQSQPQRVSKIQ